MKPCRYSRLLRTVVLGVVVAVHPTKTAIAHDGPEHVIDDLTAAMERTGASAELLFCRALEYRALRNYERAEADLRRAIEFRDRVELAAQSELVRVLVKRGKRAEALALSQSLLAAHAKEPRPDYYCELLALNGEIAYELKQWDSAAQQFSLALAKRPEVSWYVLRSRAQANLPANHSERLDGLREGYKATQSPVLLRELCDVLIESSREGEAPAEAQVAHEEIDEAAQIIEQELAASRFRSAWLLRRAKLHAVAGRKPELKADLEEALAELEPRIHPERPDVALIVERGQIRALLGDKDAARRDLEKARWGHAPDWMLAPLVAAIGDDEPPQRSKPTAVAPDE